MNANDESAPEAVSQYTCSFCGKGHDEVRRMIAGPKRVAICDACVAACNELIAVEEAKGLGG